MQQTVYFKIILFECKGLFWSKFPTAFGYFFLSKNEIIKLFPQLLVHVINNYV